jgi:hypothetical protein
VEQNRVRRLDAEGDLHGHGRDRRRTTSAQSTCSVHENPHLLITRPGKPHLGRCATDAPVHLGDGNGSARLPFDFVQKALWDPRREGEHAFRIARCSSQIRRAFAPKEHEEPL